MKRFLQLFHRGFLKLTFLGSQPEALFLWNSNSDWLGGIFSFVYKTTFFALGKLIYLNHDSARSGPGWLKKGLLFKDGMDEKKIISQGWDA